MLSDFAEWLKDLLLWLPLKVWELLLDGLASAFEAIPVPSFFQTAQGYLNGIGGNVMWALNMFAVPEGLAMLMTALIARFVLRRIPLIG